MSTSIENAAAFLAGTQGETPLTNEAIMGCVSTGGTLDESHRQLVVLCRDLERALRGVHTNPKLNLGDLVYTVREHEEGDWYAPSVIAWSNAVKLGRKVLGLK